jgi:S1-C subfamily serine protease
MGPESTDSNICTLGRQRASTAWSPALSDSPPVWHERHLPVQGSILQLKPMFSSDKFNLCRSAAKGLAAVAAALAALGLATPVAGAEGTLSYPYLDGSEAAFPSYRAVAERAAKGYVMVTLLARPDPVTRDGGGEIQTGSGIILNRDGYILTAAHIARGPQFALRVQLGDGRRLPAEVVKVSPKQELAIIKTAPLPEAVPLAFADSARVRRGEPALAVGSPRRMWGVVTVGRVRTPNIGERLDYGSWGFDNGMELSLEVESGHSGGPVVNGRGELIGMVAGYELGDTTKPQYRSPRIAYVVPVNDIRKWLGW